MSSPETEDTSLPALYEGDCGTLPLDIRRLLVTLLRGPYLWRSEKPILWSLLEQHGDLVREQLSNLFLTLLVDEEAGVAFVRQADTGDIEAPSLLNTHRYTFLDSVVLVAMRERLMIATRSASRALITDDEIQTAIRLHDPATRHDEKALRMRQDGTTKRLLDRGLLLKLKEPGSYEVSPVLRLVFDMGELEALRNLYQQKARNSEHASEILLETAAEEDSNE